MGRGDGEGGVLVRRRGAGRGDDSAGIGALGKLAARANVAEEGRTRKVFFLGHPCTDASLLSRLQGAGAAAMGCQEAREQGVDGETHVGQTKLGDEVLGWKAGMGAGTKAKVGARRVVGWG